MMSAPRACCCCCLPMWPAIWWPISWLRDEGELVVGLHLGEETRADDDHRPPVFAPGLKGVRRHPRVGLEQHPEVAVGRRCPAHLGAAEGLGRWLDPRGDPREITRGPAGTGEPSRTVAGADAGADRGRDLVGGAACGDEGDRGAEAAGRRMAGSGAEGTVERGFAIWADLSSHAEGRRPSDAAPSRRPEHIDADGGRKPPGCSRARRRSRPPAR